MATKRSADLTIRLAAAERRKLEAAAASQHLPVSTWLRQVALQAVERQALLDPAARRRRVDRALAALGSVGAQEAGRLRDEVRAVRDRWARDRR